MEQEKKPIKSKRRICAEDGCLNSAFTLKKWFVKIRPCYQIDKVRFSFVLKTEKPDERGKISFDVYMEMDTFDNWCDDILNHTLEKRVNVERQSQSQKPYYSFVTGENGGYTVEFSYSTLSDVNIHGKGRHKENGSPVGNILNANVPVNFDWLRTTAKYFIRTSKAWFENMSDIILDSSKSYRDGIDDYYGDETNTFDREESQNGEQTASNNNAVNNSNNAEKVENEADTTSQDVSNKPETKTNNKTASTTPETTSAPSTKTNLKKINLYTASSPCERTAHKGDYSLQATEKPLFEGMIANDAHSFNVVVKADVIKKLGDTWVKFLESATKTSVKALMYYTTGTEEIKGKTYDVVYLQNLEM